MCPHNRKKKDEDYMQVAYKEHLSSCVHVNSTSLIHCSSTKIHNSTYVVSVIVTLTLSASVKEVTVCQNTFSHDEITTPSVH